MIYSFKNDYAEGAHPQVLQALLESNLVQQPGYGQDAYSENAKKLIQAHIGSGLGGIHFVSGGTQANLLAAQAFLRPHEAVISAATGHIFVHEAGAIEATGHKVLAVGGNSGKLRTSDLQQVLSGHNLGPHMVKPRMVYLSNATELGTIYNRSELTDLHHFCAENNLLLYMDGARLGHALMSDENDLSLSDIAQLTDAFYIGATKNGGLIGEAIIINNPGLQADFAYFVKQKGALLAKGRLLGIQFEELFRGDLYFQLAKHANLMAMKLQNGLLARGFKMSSASTTNQIFPILPNEIIAQLLRYFDFFVWRQGEDSAVVRLITSWSTPEDQIDRFLSMLD